MLIILPYRVVVPLRRLPIANFVLIGLIAAVSILGFRQDGLAELTLIEPSGVVDSLFVHAEIERLAGNFLMLWLFGNAVCQKLGNGPYVALFLVLGIVAASAHLALDGEPAIGASGAIHGVVGVCAVLYPLNATRWTWLFYFFYRGPTMEIRSIWLISYWLVGDLLGAFFGAEDSAYVAHLAGFAAGVAFGVFVLRRGLVTMAPGERTLLDVLGLVTRPTAPDGRGD